MQNDHPSTDITKIIERTFAWLDKVVIAENFCPFAKAVREQNRIHISVQQQSDISSLLRQVVSECENLLAHERIETSLLIYTNSLKDFDDYLDFLDMANELIASAGFEGKLQLASFHPNYVFEGAPEDCASHYTNRSPYPMLHILREDSITKALEGFSKPENIPTRNIEHAKSLGAGFFLKLLS
uniref:DUF1415 domain-containing protein n=1 Tax=Ningiella ruwaisensis TaxID=2364274 RepID=UPI0010A0A60F|nr:DUF1415 domain-containing protein [Ningiella ruwaisensis]